jgi:DNA-binding winged helix-turn-helix (wHTH) protein
MSERVYKPKTNVQEYRLDGWNLCVRTNSLQRDDIKVELENRLALLLLFFIDYKGEVLSKELILKTIWPGKVVNEDSLAVAISHLRKALGDNSRSPEYIKTIPGVGYQFIANAIPIEPAPVSVAPAEFIPSPQAYLKKWLIGGLAMVLLCAVFYTLTKTEDDLSLEQELGRAQQQLSSWQSEELRLSIQSFKDILLHHPESALAYAGIAQAKIKLLQGQLTIKENCAEVIGLLDKAIQLDERLASAWIDRGNSLFWCNRDYAAAEQDYLRAISLRPFDDYAPMQYSQLLLALGQFADSMKYVESARQLNPLNYSVPTVVWIYQMQKRDDLALKELERINSAEPDNRSFHISAQRVYASLGREQEAFEHWLWLMRDSSFSDTDVQQVRELFNGAGLVGVNRWLLLRKETADLGQYTPPLSWARYALAAGEQEQALDYLEQSFAARQSALLWACIDPAYDHIRDHPRFQAIIARLQQPEFVR